MLGWLAGLAVIGVIALAIAGSARAGSSGAPATWVSWLKIALGVLLLLVALRHFRSPSARRRAADPAQMEGAIDNFTPDAALGARAWLTAVNPKNLLLAVGGRRPSQTGISGGQQAIARTNRLNGKLSTRFVAPPVPRWWS